MIQDIAIEQLDMDFTGSKTRTKRKKRKKNGSKKNLQK